MEKHHGWTDELSESEVKAMCTEPGIPEETAFETWRPYEPLDSLDVYTNNPSAVEPTATDNLAFDTVGSKFLDVSEGLLFDPASSTYKMPENFVETKIDWSQEPPKLYVSGTAAVTRDALPPPNTPPPVDKLNATALDDSDDLE